MKSSARKYQRDRQEEPDFLFREEAGGRLKIKAPYQHWGCPYCHTTDGAPYDNPRFTKGLDYVRCRTCRLVYPLPRLGREALDARVNSAFMNNHYRESIQRNQGGSPHTQANSLRVFRPELDFLQKFCPFQAGKAPRVLEVGCAEGSFLRALAGLGCRVTGVEPNRTTADFVRGQGIDLLDDFFRPGLPLPEGEFDLIVFRESLYHFFNVREALQFSRRLLADNGLIYVKCFNVDSLAIKLCAAASAGINGLDIPGNFPPDSLAYILGDSGFEVLATLYFPEHPIGGYLLKWPLARSPRLRYLRGLLNRAASRVLMSSGKSRNFATVARKAVE